MKEPIGVELGKYRRRACRIDILWKAKDLFSERLAQEGLEGVGRAKELSI
jgi:hypothetical protein